VAKKKGNIGVVTLFKTTPKKRPGRHSKSFNNRLPSRKKYRGQGR
jgi:hypothetical protein